MSTRFNLFKRNYDYLTWFIGDTASTIGSQLSSLAFILLSYAVTQDLIQAGLVSSLYAAARFVSILPGGNLIDSFSKKKLLKLYATLRFVTMLTLLILILSNQLNYPWLLIIAIVNGLLSGTFGGLTNAILPFIVQKEDLSQALTANQTRDSIISVGSAPLGGLLFTIFPVCPFLIDALLHIAVLWSATNIHAQLSVETDTKENPVTALFEGLHWVSSRIDIILILTILTISNIGNALVLSSVELQMQQEGHSGATLGFVISYFSLGMILGGLSSRRAHQSFQPNVIILGAFGIQAVVYLLLSLSTEWYFIATLLFIVTLPIISLNAILGVYQMQQTPDNLQGRVGTVFMFIIGIGPILSGGLAGTLLSATGWQTSIIFAMVTSLLAFLCTLTSKTLRNLKVEIS